MENIAICIIIGYLLGTLNPAALLSRLKKIDLKACGTGNLGATNAMMVLGKGCGAFVLLVDMAKAYAATALCSGLFQSPLAGIIAGGTAVLGHIFPFYLHFKGGKGLAPLAGMVLAADPLSFLILMTIGLILMFIINYGMALTYSAAILSPIVLAIRLSSFGAFMLCEGISCVIIAKHIENIERIRTGKDKKIRQYIKSSFFGKG